MDLNTLRVVVTLLSLAAFAGIVAWAWLKRNQAAFAQAARLALDDETPLLPVAGKRGDR